MNSPAGAQYARRVRRWTTAVLVTAAVIFGPGLVQWGQLCWRSRQLDRRLARLSAERERLTREQERLETDPGYVEGLIRTTFKWARDGELVIPLDEPDGRQAR